KQIQKLKFMEALLPVGNEDKSTAVRDVPKTSAFDRHEILEVIGEGGMGIVYKVRERDTGRIVALKKMKHFDATALERFKKECHTLLDIQHPNLVTIYDVISDVTHWFSTMELIEGRPIPGRRSYSASDTPVPVTIDQSSLPPDILLPEGIS